jgi:glucose/arabinose dehydrogenase
VLLAAVLAGCSGTTDEQEEQPVTGAPSPSTSAPPQTPSEPAPAPPAATAAEPVSLDVTEVARDLDTVWSLAWDPEGKLWYTERPGFVSQLGGPTVQVEGVVESREGGLMGLEIDEEGRFFLMYTAADENRVVRLEPDGSQTVLVDGIAAGSSHHDGGRIRLGPGGSLFVSTGDAGVDEVAQDPDSLNGKILRVDPASGELTIFSAGHRNAQGLCFAPDGRFYSTEHGPDRGDEINILAEGENGGWPDVVGNGIWNYTPTIAPAGCAYYDAELIPQWRGSLLFVTLKDQSLRRLSLAEDGSVEGEEVLYRGEFGRLRDVAVGPDGAVYLATSNHDGRGDPQDGDDRILRIGPPA